MPHPEVGPVVWLTGLPFAGKSTLARAAAGELRGNGIPVEVLDGEELRAELYPALGFTPAERAQHARVMASMAARLSRNGVVVLVAAVSPFRAARRAAREQIGAAFVEVHVDASSRACAKRDSAGLYARAEADEIADFTGVSQRYEPPESPELRLDTDCETVEQAVAYLVAFIRRRLNDAPVEQREHLKHRESQ